MYLFANPKEQYLSYKSEIQEAINRVLESGWYILGEEVKLFEKELANFIESKFAISVASGTDALFLSLKALNIGHGDEVITVSHTATATVSAIKASGAKAIMVDIEEDYYTIDIDKISANINKNTKAIIAVHIYGQPCEMDNLIDLASSKNIPIIEDCAQSCGAEYKGRKVGSIGTLGCFSFFPTKNLGAIGDGGAITTNSEEIYEKLLKLRQYGWDLNRDSKYNGYNSRLDELQAAILRVKLDHLKSDTLKRNKIANFYRKYLNNNIILPLERKNCLHAYHLFVIKTTDRDGLKKYLKEKNILTMVHYEKPIHKQSAFISKYALEITESISHNILSLPMYPELKEEDIIYISNSINSFGENHG